MLEQLDELTKCSNVWEGKDAGVALQIVACVGQFLLCEDRDFIHNRREEPICVWFASDGTEHRYKKSKLARLGSGIAIRRLRAKADFLQQRLFCFDSCGGRCSLIPEAVVMLNKTVWAHFEQQRHVAPHPRFLGHRLTLVQHGCWDGVVVGGCHKHSLQLEQVVLLKLQRD